VRCCVAQHFYVARRCPANWIIFFIYWYLTRSIWLSRMVVASTANPCIVKLGTQVYDFTALAALGPFTGTDQSGQYTFNFNICKPLATACPNHGGSPVDVSKCDSPGVAAVCQSWAAGANRYSACTGQTSMVSYSAYSSGSGTENSPLWFGLFVLC
jgi:hypothetical protein